jgi:hypothetical protein
LVTWDDLANATVGRPAAGPVEVAVDAQQVAASAWEHRRAEDLVKLLALARTPPDARSGRRGAVAAPGREGRRRKSA